MNYTNRIHADHRIMLGKPVVKGTRITVEMLLRKLSEGATTDDLLTMYPTLTADDILAVFQYASSVLAGEEVIMLDVA